MVWTGDERVFFYNPTTRLSMWDRPDELVGRTDVDKHIQEPPHKRGLEEVKKTGGDKQSHAVRIMTFNVVLLIVMRRILMAGLMLRNSCSVILKCCLLQLMKYLYDVCVFSPRCQ